MYEFAEDRLGSEGYIHYEISNWARAPEFVSRHNIRYWQRKPYIGLGVAAHSFMNGRRFENVHSPELYIQAWSGEYCVAQQAKSPRHNPAAIAAELVDKEAAMAEVMFLGLRTAEGVLFKAFAAEFGEDLSAVYGSAITDLVEGGLLEEDSTGVRLTRRGRLLGNQVFYRFLPPVTENGQAKTAPQP
jgi:oxygen-independent coproporphyrinogen-3 oxidase